MKKVILYLVAIVGSTSFANIAYSKPKPERIIGIEASIPNVRYAGVNDFQPDGNDALWLQDRSRKWYYAKLSGPCANLPFANEIGVVTQGGDSLDRFGRIVAIGPNDDTVQAFDKFGAKPVERAVQCPIISLVTSNPPLTRKKSNQKQIPKVSIKSTPPQ